MYIIMGKEFVNINLRLKKETYDFLRSISESGGPTVSAAIRIAIDKYVHSAVQNNVQPVQLKPLTNLINPVTHSMESKKPLEIPTTEFSSVIESEPLISHKSERKIRPDLYAVMKARRARDAGREYDVALEQHFHLLDELK